MKHSNMTDLKDDSIFDNLPEKFRPKVTCSVELRKSKAKNSEPTEFSKMSNNFYKPSKDKVSIDLTKKISKLRKKQNDSTKLVRNTRRDIAQRIYFKLQNWPEYDVRQSKPLKKFYWTKDYSHCAFASEDEIVDGFLVKP